MEHITEINIFKKSTSCLIIYENRKENKLFLFVSIDLVTMHEIKYRASKMGSTNIVTAAKQMNIFLLQYKPLKLIYFNH